jgi:DnaJ-class molecular chaperone
MCTDGRWNIGGDRQARKREAQREVEESLEAVEEERLWETSLANPANGTCPDCDGTGRCSCADCKNETCLLCGGSGLYD